MFEFLKRKIRRRKVSMECVYAGPEQMGRPRPVQKEPEVKPAQAEPEKVFSEDAGMECVYAGPEDVEIEEVYAGPGMMDELDREDAEEPEDAVTEGVYAGPQDLQNNQPVMPGPAPMSFVYAGPGGFGGQKVPDGGIRFTFREPRPYPENYAVAEEEEPAKPRPREARVFCPECGKPWAPGIRQCTCGYVFKRDEEQEAEENNTGNPAKPLQEDRDLNADLSMTTVYAGPGTWDNKGKA